MTEETQNGIVMPMNKGSTKFKGIWIPAYIIAENSLSLPEKVLLAVIESLCKNSEGTCTANNKYFASILSCTDRRIQQMLKKLREKGMIEVRNQFRDSAKNISCRGVKYISLTPRKIFHPYNKGDKKELIIISEPMKKAFSLWKNYRKEVNRPLVPSSEKASFEKLLKLSNNDPLKAERIVQQTIENGWHSLQPIKTNNSNKEELPVGIQLKKDCNGNFENFNF